MSVPRVSVVIPIYNVEKYLGECLDSVIAQTERSIEIICVNDGATDSSPKIIDKYALHEPRIIRVDRVNGGLSAARNSGLDVARGEYVMFVDSDDKIPPDAVAEMLRVADESGAAIVAADGFFKDQISKANVAKSITWRKMSPALEKFVANRHIRSSAWNKLYLRSLIGDRRFLSGIFFEDWPFNTELFAEIPFFALVNRPMYIYRTSNESIVRSPFSMRKAESYVAGIEHVAKIFTGRADFPIAAKRIAMAVKMLVSKASRSHEMSIRRYVATQDFSRFPLDLKTRWRLFKLIPFGKRLENLFHSVVAAIGRFEVLYWWRKIEPRKIVINQFQGGGWGCNPKYVALELLRRGGWDVVWTVRKGVQDVFPPGIRTVPFGSRAALREYATAKVWLANHNLGRYVRHLGLVKKTEQIYVQTWHGSFGIKRCTEVLSPDEIPMLDAFIANCSWEANLVHDWFSGRVESFLFGHPRNDIMFAPRSEDGVHRLLYVPTFRDDGDTSKYLVDFEPIVESLCHRWSGKWCIQARLHPNLRRKKIKLPFSKGVEDVTDYPDIQELLAKADVVVSDYSSCIFDFALSMRPAFIYAPDRAKYETGRGFYYSLSQTPFPVAEDVNSLCVAIEEFDETVYLQKCRRFYQEKGSVEDGHASERTVEWLESKIKAKGNGV